MKGYVYMYVLYLEEWELNAFHVYLDVVVFFCVSSSLLCSYYSSKQMNVQCDVM